MIAWSLYVYAHTDAKITSELLRAGAFIFSYSSIYWLIKTETTRGPIAQLSRSTFRDP